MVWTLLAASEPRLAAAAPFYGPFPEGARFNGSKAAVLGIYAGTGRAREREPAGRGRGTARGGLPHELVTFPGADHAFFNDTGAERYNPTRRDRSRGAGR